MLTLERIKFIVSQITFNDWMFVVGTYQEGTPYIQILFKDKDRISGVEEIQRCRKWILSFHMVDSEVIRTAYKAVEAAMLHEVQEAFKYKNARIFNPHLDLEELADAINAKVVSVSLRDETTYAPRIKKV